MFALASTSCVCAAAPVYEPKDIDVSSNAVTCRVAGTPLLDGDAFSNAGFWTLNNYENRLGIEMGGERDGVRGLCLDGSEKVCDSAWSATSGRIRLKGAGCRYRLGFSIDTSVSIKLPNHDGESWRSQIDWFGADGGKISTELLAYTVPRGRRTVIAISGDIPDGAASCSLRFAFDIPNIGPANRVIYSGLTFEELADPPSYATAAEFLSEIHSGGKVSWLADAPDGCAVLFQWRGASSPEELARKPFVGPDGTDGSFFTAPFAANAPLIQYRALLRSNTSRAGAAGSTSRRASSSSPPPSPPLSTGRMASPGTPTAASMKTRA